MLGHLARVLEQVAADADVRLSRLELLGEAERAPGAGGVEPDGAAVPAGRVHPRAVRGAGAARGPDAVALVWGEESLTYRELDARANRLAHHLGRAGRGPGGAGGRAAGARALELVVSILAVLKAGGAYVPLDPGYPRRAAARSCWPTAASACCSAAATLARGGRRPAACDVVRLDQAADALASEPVEAPRSGATAGEPGVRRLHQREHRAAQGRDGAHRARGPARRRDRLRAAAARATAWRRRRNASFDALTFEVWGALLNGATLVGIPPRRAPLARRAARRCCARSASPRSTRPPRCFNQLVARAAGRLRAAARGALRRRRRWTPTACGGC